MSQTVLPGAGDRASVLLSHWAEGRYEDVAANFDANGQVSGLFILNPDVP